MDDVPTRLWQFPFVRVRIGCTHCPKRHGSYNLARLAERFGADALLIDVLYRLTQSCRWQVPSGAKRRPYVPYCRAAFVDLAAGTPPDTPPDDDPPPAPALRLVA